VGRPLNKKSLGGFDNIAIPVRFCNSEGLTVYGTLVGQLSNTKFKCSETRDTDNFISCSLVNKTENLLEGECALIGITPDLEQVTIAKIFNRTAHDFEGNRYTWESQDDSTESILILIKI